MNYRKIIQLDVVELYLNSMKIQFDWNKSYYAQSWAMNEAMRTLSRVFHTKARIGKTRAQTLFEQCAEAFNALPF